MRINVTTRHGKTPDDIERYIRKKGEKLKKYYNGIIDVEVVLDYQKRDQEVDMRVTVSGNVLTAIVKTDNLHRSIDEALHKIETQIKKYKERLRHVNHKKAVDNLIDGDDSSEES